MLPHEPANCQTGTTTSVHVLQRGAAEDVAVAGSPILAQPSAGTAAAAAAAAADVCKDQRALPLPRVPEAIMLLQACEHSSCCFSLKPAFV